MDTQYDAKRIEEKQYEKWLDNGSFTVDPSDDKPPFTIIMPPPNITGQLHMGHALDNTMQDILIRTKRMQGFSALWIPGSDHASIATEVKIVEKMREEGVSKADIGREGFLERAWEWKEEYGGRIYNQIKKLGSSCDWSRERFTMDKTSSDAVLEAFVRLYDKGLIYRGDRIINWCPTCKTSLSDIEVEYEDQAGHLWHIKYPLEDGSGEIIVATTRPETMLGDTAVAVHPDDPKYKDMIGKNLKLPLTDRVIPIVADEYVEMGFGSGAVKITPAHDPNDFEVGERHNLPIIRIMDDAGHINELGGKYSGLERYEARKQMVADLTELGLLDHIEDHQHNVGECYRCGTTVEPIISKQWFLKMDTLAKNAIKVVEDGEMKFVPQRFEKIYYNWMYNIRDWNISRQLWWGHQIPAYYCEDCGEIIVSKEKVDVCPKCGSNHIHQDEDVLDTWFSSGLWPFSTLGWPNDTAELNKYYPTSVLVTAYDIIFFWVARMIVFGVEMTGKAPFETACIHGLVRDSQGRKMSKSLGNGIDPLEVVEKYGADALRFSLARGTSPGNDMRYYDERVEHSRNFANKIWNASRFVLMSCEEGKEYKINQGMLDYADKWMLQRLNEITEQVTSEIDRYEIGVVSDNLYDFIWGEFCDWYIELVKPRLYGEDQNEKDHIIAMLITGLNVILKLLHPFMPFITEEIYENLPNNDGSLMLSAWPVRQDYDYADEAEKMKNVMDMIVEIRRIRADRNVPPSRKSDIYLVADENVLSRLKTTDKYLKRLAYGEVIHYLTDKQEIPKNALSAVCVDAQIYLPLTDLIDFSAEKDRLEKEQKRLLGEIKRAEGKLNNQGFVSKAPASLIEEEKGKLNDYQRMFESVVQELSTLCEMEQE